MLKGRRALRVLVYTSSEQLARYVSNQITLFWHYSWYRLFPGDGSPGYRERVSQQPPVFPPFSGSRPSPITPLLDPKTNLFRVAKPICLYCRPETDYFSGFHLRLSFSGRLHQKKGVRFRMKSLPDNAVRVWFETRHGRQQACTDAPSILDTPSGLRYSEWSYTRSIGYFSYSEF